jgi:hypothetical protein
MLKSKTECTDNNWQILRMMSTFNGQFLLEIIQPIKIVPASPLSYI